MSRGEAGKADGAEVPGSAEALASMHRIVAPVSEIRESLEWMACPLCGARESQPRHLVCGYTIVDCVGCRLTFVNPQPTDADLASFYETAFHTPAWYKRFPQLRDFDYFGEAASDEAGHQSYVELVRGLIPSGAWLDVGCGHGRLAGFAAAAGYEVFGVDPNPLAAQVAQQRLGADRVFVGPLEASGLPADHFTVVSMIGTIEHLKRPLQTLRESLRVLEPGGMLLIQTPNLGSLQYRRQGEAWDQFTPPGHLIYFTPRTLRWMLETAGFQRVRFDMRFPLEAGWDHGAAVARRRPRRLGLLVARAVSLLGSRCERAAQRVKGRLVGNHDILCHARKSQPHARGWR
jgi:SAM-dependent methyltransferase